MEPRATQSETEAEHIELDAEVVADLEPENDADIAGGNYPCACSIQGTSGYRVRPA